MRSRLFPVQLVVVQLCDRFETPRDEGPDDIESLFVVQRAQVSLEQSRPDVDVVFELLGLVRACLEVFVQSEMGRNDGERTIVDESTPEFLHQQSVSDKSRINRGTHGERSDGQERKHVPEQH